MFGHARRVASRRIHHQHAAPRRLFEVNVVHAHSGPADHAQARRLLHQRASVTRVALRTISALSASSSALWAAPPRPGCEDLPAGVGEQFCCLRTDFVGNHNFHGPKSLLALRLTVKPLAHSSALRRQLRIFALRFGKQPRFSNWPLREQACLRWAAPCPNHSGPSRRPPLPDSFPGAEFLLPPDLERPRPHARRNQRGVPNREFGHSRIPLGAASRCERSFLRQGRSRRPSAAPLRIEPGGVGAALVRAGTRARGSPGRPTRGPRYRHGRGADRQQRHVLSAGCDARPPHLLAPGSSRPPRGRRGPAAGIGHADVCLLFVVFLRAAGRGALARCGAHSFSPGDANMPVSPRDAYRAGLLLGVAIWIRPATHVLAASAFFVAIVVHGIRERAAAAQGRTVRRLCWLWSCCFSSSPT